MMTLSRDLKDERELTEEGLVLRLTGQHVRRPGGKRDGVMGACGMSSSQDGGESWPR